MTSLGLSLGLSLKSYGRRLAPVAGAPIINSAAASSVAENLTLSHGLSANEPVTWAIRTVGQNAASVDHDKFELSGSILRWAANGTKDFEAPNDTGTNNTYVVVVRATDVDEGLTTDLTHTVTVTNVADAATLSALTLDGSTVPEDVVASINILGAATGSTLTVQSGSLPTGLTLNSGPRTITGTPTTSGSSSFTLRETLADSPNSPLDTALGITVSAAVGIGAPVLALTSSAGVSPVTWTVDTTGTSIYAGYYWHLQVDNTSNAFPSPEQDIYQLITADEFGDLDSLIEDFVQPSGLYYLRLRAVIDDGASGPGSGTNGAWSNVLTDTIVSATTVLETTGGANKNNFLIVSGTPALDFHGTDGIGIPQYVRGTSNAIPSGKYGFAVDVAGFASGGVLVVGVDSNATAVGAATFPGVATLSNNGVFLYINQGGNCDIYSGGSAVQSGISSNSPNTAGDRVIVEVDKGTGSDGTISFYRERAAVKAQIGTTITGLSSSVLARACIGAGNTADAGSANFGQSSITLNSGYAIYG